MDVYVQELLRLLAQGEQWPVPTDGLRITFPTIRGEPLPSEEFNSGRFVVRMERVLQDGDEYVVSLQISKRERGREHNA